MNVLRKANEPARITKIFPVEIFGGIWNEKLKKDLIYKYFLYSENCRWMQIVTRKLAKITNNWIICIGKTELVNWDIYLTSSKKSILLCIKD